MELLQLSILGLGALLLLLAILDWYIQSYRYQSWQKVQGTALKVQIVEGEIGRVYLPFWTFYRPEITYSFKVGAQRHTGVYTEHPSLEKERINQDVKTVRENPDMAILVNPQNPTESIPLMFVDRYPWARMIMAAGGLFFLALVFLVKR